MKFKDTYFSREHRYSLGIESESGTHYLEIPVSNRMVDYSEGYKLSPEEYELFMSDTAAAFEFANSCRRREQDARLFHQPGSDRGVASPVVPAGLESRRGVLKDPLTYFSPEHRYFLGVAEGRTHFAAIPVDDQTDHVVQRYTISPAEHGLFLSNTAVADDFIESCRRREQDGRLLAQPGTDPGTPSAPDVHAAMNSLDWLRKAADAGIPQAMLLLGDQLEIGDPPDLPAARIWYQKAADAGHPQAMASLGYLLQNWNPPDLPGARIWYQKAAEAGVPQAMANLGILLEKGDPADLPAARIWYQKGAEAGNPQAMERFAVRLLFGDPPDRPAALHWLRKAADAGVPQAMNSLGILLEAGDPPDLPGARAWFQKAADAGVPHAMDYLRRLADADPDPRLLAELDRRNAALAATPGLDADMAFWKVAAQLGSWFFINRGTDDHPRPYGVQQPGAGMIVCAYSSAERAREAAVELGLAGDGDTVPMFSIPMPRAIDWVAELSAAGVVGAALDHRRNGGPWTGLSNLATMKTWMTG